MTSICTLPGCGQPSGDAQVCHRCVNRLVKRLTDGRWLADQLTITITRQDRITDGGRRAGEPPLPYREEAAERYWTLRNTLTTWARDLCGDVVPDGVGDTIGDLAEWLAQRATQIRRHPAAGQLVDELDDALTQAWRIIDRPPTLWPAGECGDNGCTGQLLAHLDAVVVSCPECGTLHDVEVRMAWLVDQAECVLLTAAEMTRAMGALDIEVTADRIRKWAERKRLMSKGTDGRGRALYRLGDVRDLLTARMRRAVQSGSLLDTWRDCHTDRDRRGVPDGRTEHGAQCVLRRRTP